MISFALERYATCAEEMVVLGADHQREIRPHLGAFPWDPDLEAWKKLDDLGLLNTAVARDGATMAGYFVSVVMPHLHFKGVRYAHGDGLWLSPSYRRPRLADRLLAFAEDSLRARGVILNIVGVHPDHPSLGRLLTRRGYALTSLGYSRRL